MILINIRGQIFNPFRITYLLEGHPDADTINVFFSDDTFLTFQGVSMDELSTEINNAIYDHEYYLTLRRIAAQKDLK